MTTEDELEQGYRAHDDGFENVVKEILETAFDALEGFEGTQVSTYTEACMMTSNDGLVVRFANGDEYQLTIVKSR